MNLHYLILSMGLIALAPGNESKENKLLNDTKGMPAHKVAFVNAIVDGGKCNTFGYDKYVQNSDAQNAYTVTVKVVEFKAGAGTKEFQKVVAVSAGGKTYVGCSVSADSNGPGYTYSVIGESK